MEKNQEKNEALVMLNGYLDRLIPGIDEMVNNFYEGNESFALEKLTVICDGLQWSLRVLNVTKDVIELGDKVDSLVEQFNSIVEALENEDYILVSDLFNYEVKDLLQTIKEEIEKFV